MPLLQDFRCRACNEVYEFMPREADAFLEREAETAICPKCGSQDAELQLNGGHQFHVIRPAHPATQQSRAGYVHKHQNRPAEKTSISVPR